MPTEFDNLLLEADAGESSSDPGAERCGRLRLVAHRVAQNLSDLLLRASSMLARTLLELRLHIVI